MKNTKIFSNQNKLLSEKLKLTINSPSVLHETKETGYRERRSKCTFA